MTSVKKNLYGLFTGACFNFQCYKEPYRNVSESLEATGLDIKMNVLPRNSTQRLHCSRDAFLEFQIVRTIHGIKALRGLTIRSYGVLKWSFGDFSSPWWIPEACLTLFLSGMRALCSKQPHSLGQCLFGK